MSSPVPIPPRPSQLALDEEDPVTEAETETLPEGNEALGCVSPLRESTRQKWLASSKESPSSSAPKGTLEDVERRLAEAESRREQFRSWMRTDDDAASMSATRVPTQTRVARAAKRREHQQKCKQDVIRARMERLMEGALRCCTRWRSPAVVPDPLFDPTSSSQRGENQLKHELSAQLTSVVLIRACSR